MAKKQNKNKEKNINCFRIIGLIALIIIVILIGVFIFINNKENAYVDKNVSFKIPNTYKEDVNEEEKESWRYTPKKDLSGSSGIIDVTVVSDENGGFSDIEDAKKSFTEALDGYNILNKEDFINSHKHQVIGFTIDFTEYTEYLYFIFYENNYAIIDGLDYENIKNGDISKTTKEIAESFDWKK